MLAPLAHDPRRRRGLLLAAAVVLLGTALRFAIAKLGHNFDLDSYRLVADIMRDRGTVYAETERYNYGPVWFWLLHLFDTLGRALDTPQIFRGAIIATLTAADLACAAVLWRRFGGLVAAAFFLNPVSIIITGYHNQFDTLAIAVGVLGLVWFEARSCDHRMVRLVPPLLVLGLSLSIKHVLFMVPLWLTFGQSGLRRRLLVLLLPPAVFALGFVPYLEAWDGIRAHVFEYEPFANGLYTGAAPDVIQSVLSPTAFLVVGLAAVGWFHRDLPPFQQLLHYLPSLICFAPAIANQYLAIPMLAVIALMNVGFAVYAFIATVLLMARADGLHWQWLSDLFGPGVDGFGIYTLPATLMLAGVGLLLWPKLVRPRGASSSTASSTSSKPPRL